MNPHPNKVKYDDNSRVRRTHEQDQEILNSYQTISSHTLEEECADNKPNHAAKNHEVNEVMSMESESDTQSSNQQKVQEQKKTALPKIVIQPSLYKPPTLMQEELNKQILLINQKLRLFKLSNLQGKRKKNDKVKSSKKVEGNHVKLNNKVFNKMTSANSHTSDLKTPQKARLTSINEYIRKTDMPEQFVMTNCSPKLRLRAIKRNQTFTGSVSERGNKSHNLSQSPSKQDQLGYVASMDPYYQKQSLNLAGRGRSKQKKKLHKIMNKAIAADEIFDLNFI